MQSIGFVSLLVQIKVKVIVDLWQLSTTHSNLY